MTLFLSLLGPVGLTVDARARPWGQDQRFLLLAFLAYQAKWVSREQLQDLFWPDHAPQAARNNLRQLISRVRALAAAPDLQVERGRLRWAVDTDVAAFTRAVAERRWAEAVNSYGGTLLADLMMDGSSTLNAWLELERERLRGAWRLAVLHRSQELGEGGWYLEAADLLKALLEAEELDEVILQAYVMALLGAGGRNQALHACETFVRRLHDELGLDPTVNLVQMIQALQSPEAQIAPNLPLNVPARTPGAGLLTAATSFIGRGTELAEVRRLLTQTTCRLLTLTGPGGIGKTRLAQEAARQLTPEYPDGVYHVPLAGLTDHTLIASGVADLLGLTLRGQATPLNQVTREIGQHKRLLVLDNYEHLLEGAGIVAELVQQCPNLRVLVTSRERLGVPGEWLLALGGLEYPDTPDVGEVEGQYFDAVQLFIERARCGRLDFDVQSGAWAKLLRLCQLVDGSPLALELAATWVRSLSLPDIVREVESNLDFLTTDGPGRERRHRSLRAVFESSWHRLTPPEQETLRRLSVFRGGFALEAARWVTGASPAVLAALIDRSLLRVNAQGRYSRHAQLYQYMVEKLAEHPEEAEEVERRHGHYYLGWLAREGEAILGPGGGSALSRLDEEMENVRVAWNRAAANCPEDLRPAVIQGALYHDRRARFQEGLDAYARAAQGLAAALPAQRRLLGDVLIRQGWFAMRLGRHTEARRLAGRGLTLLPPEGPAAMHGHNALGNIAELTGAYDEARQHFQAAIRLARTHGLPAREADLSTHLAAVETAQGRYALADVTGQHALALYARLGYHVGTVFGLTQCGNLELAQGRLDGAAELFAQGLSLARQLGVHQRVPDGLHGLAEIAFQRGCHDQAQTHAHEELTLARTEGNQSAQVQALGLLGRLAAARRTDPQAAAYLARGLHLARALGETPRLLELLIYVAEWHLARGEDQLAAPLLRAATVHPATVHRLRHLAEQLATLSDREWSDQRSPSAPDSSAELDPVALSATTLNRLLPTLDWTLADLGAN